MGALGCPAYNLTIDGGRFRRWSGPKWGVDHYLYAMSLSGSMRAPPAVAAPAAHSPTSTSRVWSPAASRSGVFDGSPVGDCGGPLDVLFPEEPLLGIKRLRWASDFETPWWYGTARRANTSHRPFFTHQSFIRSYDLLTMSGTQHRGAGSHSFYLLGESHAFGYLRQLHSRRPSASSRLPAKAVIPAPACVVVHGFRVDCALH